MIDTYLFDWGDTLMVDFPGVPGKMRDWPKVATITGAEETLAKLSQQARIFIATGAAESTEEDIKQAFERVGLDQFISGYFCKANLGISKGSPDFLQTILEKLQKSASAVAMVGDNLSKDIRPAAAVGITPIWLTHTSNNNAPEGTKIITELRELIQRSDDSL